MYILTHIHNWMTLYMYNHADHHPHQNIAYFHIPQEIPPSLSCVKEEQIFLYPQCYLAGLIIK